MVYLRLQKCLLNFNHLVSATAGGPYVPDGQSHEAKSDGRLWLIRTILKMHTKSKSIVKFYKVIPHKKSVQSILLIDHEFITNN